ncbi:FhaA domain-containing protein [Aestuariimicrobium ganziense]|uniref:FhaA domain-containing protein n=1 Tax=Aestuariimicrobium ganziense TaxID=2773677 RepID=UPI0019411A43|nr:FhaA domain-containing protein [Aestuariimicrobium ganziense]
MGLLDRLEKRIEGAVNGVFARAFKGDVQPVEIAARLQRELDAEAKLLSRDKRLVPNHFMIGLSPRDHDRLAPYAKTLNAEIVPELREYAGERRYVFNGPITIEYDLDESLPTGRFTVASEAAAGVSSSERGHGHSRTRLVLEVNGVRHPLTEPGLLIGRGSEADLRINDPGISRKHAMIHVAGTGDSQRVTIEDLGSTNGITVNGTKCRQATITDGTRLEIGTTRMLVHAPVGS